MHYIINHYGKTMEEIYGFTTVELADITIKFFQECQQGVFTFDDYDRYILSAVMLGALPNAALVAAKMLPLNIDYTCIAVSKFVEHLQDHTAEFVRLMTPAYYTYLRSNHADYLSKLPKADS